MLAVNVPPLSSRTWPPLQKFGIANVPCHTSGLCWSFDGFQPYLVTLYVVVGSIGVGYVLCDGVEPLAQRIVNFT